MPASFPIRILIAMLSLAIMATLASAAPYIKPDDEKELFKVEKIPLQVDSMKELAKHLIVIANREQTHSPNNRRATGQLLALAVRLDPANQDVREINDTLTKGETMTPARESVFKTAKSRIRFYSRWLASPEAGADANLLARYLTDATRTLYPDSANNPDTASWEGVIPPLKKYHPQNQDNPPALPKPPKNGDAENPGMDKDGDNTPAAPKPPSPPATSVTYHLKNQSISAPYTLERYERYNDPKSPGTVKWRTIRYQQVSTVELSLSPKDANTKNTFVINPLPNRNSNKTVSSPIENDPTYKSIRSTLHQLMRSRHSKLPDSKISVKLIGGGAYNNSNKISLVAPIALMLEASIANTPLRKDIHICATIDNAGNLKQPDNFWLMLKTLRQSQVGGRLIVAKESYDLMIQVLVYDEADFFTRWEVICADNFDEALIAATQKSPPTLTEAAALFDSIQNLARKSSVPKLAVNRAVRSRLGEIVRLAPNHASAKILLIQGSGKRPMRLSEKALALELLPTVNKMHRALSKQLNANHLPATTLKNIHESCRSAIDPIERIVDRSQNELYVTTLKQVNEFRRLMTVVRRYSGANSTSSQKKKATSLFYSMQRDCTKLQARMLVAAGFPPPAKDN